VEGEHGPEAVVRLRAPDLDALAGEQRALPGLGRRLDLEDRRAVGSLAAAEAHPPRLEHPAHLAQLLAGHRGGDPAAGGCRRAAAGASISRTVAPSGSWRRRKRTPRASSTRPTSIRSSSGTGAVIPRRAAAAGSTTARSASRKYCE